MFPATLLWLLFGSGFSYYSALAMTAVPYFRDLELIITEGEPKSVFVELSTNVIKPLTVQVYVASLARFEEILDVDSLQCTQISGDLNVNSSLLDSTEDSDLAMMEFLLMFNDSITNQSFSVEAVDDVLSEKEEWFVLYLNASHSRCAISVAIQDNDVLRFNFSTSNPIITLMENDGIVTCRDLYVTKYGYNEPNITFSLKVESNTSTPAIRGSDFEIQTEMVFTADNFSQCVHIEIYDDNIFEGDGEFLLCLPDLYSTNSDVMLIEANEPKCITITIIDDDVVVGFTESVTAIREGAGPQSLCVSVLQGTLSGELQLNLVTMTMRQYDELLLENSSFVLDPAHPLHCFNVLVVDDEINLLNSTFLDQIQLISQQNQTSFGILNPAILQIEIWEDDVVTFLEEPGNVTTVIMGQAYFPCRYTGTRSVPKWRIMDSNGVSKQYPTATLPPFHFFNGSGLLVTKISQSVNLTSYSCFFELNRAGLYEISSSSGTVFILTPVTFELQAMGGLIQGKEISFGEGTNDNYIVINKRGYTNLTFIVTLEVKRNNEGLLSRLNFTANSFLFEPSQTKVIVPFEIIEDFLPEGQRSYQLSIAKPVDIIGHGVNDPSVITGSLNISIYDNDYAIGFMSFSRLYNNESTRVCVTFFHEAHDIDPFTDIHLVISEINDFVPSGTELNLSSNHLRLNQSHQMDCIPVTASNYSRCSGVDLVHTLEVSLDNSSAHNIYIQQRYSQVLEMQQQCYVGDSSYIGEHAIYTGTVVVVVFIAIICLNLIMICCSVWYAVMILKHSKYASSFKNVELRLSDEVTETSV